MHASVFGLPNLRTISRSANSSFKWPANGWRLQCEKKKDPDIEVGEESRIDAVPNLRLSDATNALVATFLRK
jgi:hypothetical protein